jgi:WD40 repeat protein
LFPNTLKIVQGAELRWSACLRAISHPSAVICVAFSADGRHIVSGSGSGDGTVRIWDAETGAEVSAPLVGHSNRVNSVAFSPNCRHIVSGSRDNTVRIWDAETGAEVSAPLVGHSNWVNSVAFSSDGRHVVSGSRDNTVRIWDAETGAEVFAPRIWDAENQVNTPRGVYCPDVVPHLSSNASRTCQLMDENGWISMTNQQNLFWIPAEYRRLNIDDAILCISRERVPSQVIFDFSNFVHGSSWTSVHPHHRSQRKRA